MYLLKNEYFNLWIATVYFSKRKQARTCMIHIITKFDEMKNKCLSHVIPAKISLNVTENVTFISITTDTSNHTNIKMFPIVARYFFIDIGVKYKLIDTYDLQNEKAENMETKIESFCEKYNISNKVVGFNGNKCVDAI